MKKYLWIENLPYILSWRNVKRRNTNCEKFFFEDHPHAKLNSVLKLEERDACFNWSTLLQIRKLVRFGAQWISLLHVPKTFTKPMVGSCVWNKRPRSEGTPKSNTTDKLEAWAPMLCIGIQEGWRWGLCEYPSLVSQLTHPRACDYLCGYSCHFNPQVKNAPNFKGGKEKVHTHTMGCTLF